MMIAIMLGVLMVLMALVLWKMHRELHDFQVVEYGIRSHKLNGLKEDKKIIFLSDLHNHVYGDDNAPLLAAIKEADPECILIGGDMLIGKDGYSYEPAEKFVKSLTDICEVYYANGNHEQRMKEQPEEYEQSYAVYKASLEKSGVHFLENENVEILFEDIGVSITGLEIPRECYTHFRRKEMPEGAIEKRIGTSQSERFQILLAHNPVYMKEYLAWGADLILSGHLHGGMVRIPGLGGVIAPNMALFPKYSGDLYREGEQNVVVSKGLGTHTISVRLFNPAEVVVLNVGGMEK